MKVTFAEFLDLSETYEICSRPLRCKGKPLRHEDATHCNDNLVIVQLDNVPVVPECENSRQHLACPHLLQREFLDPNGVLSRAIMILRRNNRSEIETQCRELTDATAIAEDFDGEMRMARTGIDIDDDTQNLVIIPDTETARKNAAPIEARYLQFAANTVRPIQSELLKLIDDALSELEICEATSR